MKEREESRSSLVPLNVKGGLDTCVPSVITHISLAAIKDAGKEESETQRA